MSTNNSDKHLLVEPHLMPSCPIVGVGASAGGLEAYEQFLSSVVDDHGIAYVFIQHLDPTHKSMLGQLLSRRSKISVETIEGGERVQPSTVYLTPPNAQISIENGVLELVAFPEPRGRRRPIDFFFLALAKDQGKNAACVILSGTGSDGSDGLRAIKASGGLTIAQDTTFAKYSGMPRSAVDTGMIDLVLPAEKMAPLIAQYFGQEKMHEGIEHGSKSDFLEQIVHTIRYRSGHDFSQYKRATLLRRIARRMFVTNSKSEHDYLQLLVSNADEADNLFRDFLINVTNFLRDRDAFEALQKKAIPKICENKGAGETIRVWVPGVSSGEEAYSVAMLLSDYLKPRNTKPRIHIFATDIDKSMIERARRGVYSTNIVEEVPDTFISEYFDPHQNGYQICRDIRDMVHFSVHSLIKDPPFAKIDLLTCRNLLIYFDSNLQKKVTPIFHYALNPKGFLFLGAAESLTSIDEYFFAIDKKAKLFRRRDVKTPLLGLPILGESQASISRISSVRTDNDLLEDDVRGRLLASYMPPHIVVSRTGQILFASKRTGSYLEFQPGVPVLNIENLARDQVKQPIADLMRDLESSPLELRHYIDVNIGDDEMPLKIDIYAERMESGNFLIIFNDRKLKSGAGAFLEPGAIPMNADAQPEKMHILERDLLGARQDLKSTVEELETTNEELKSSNEEMMSMNEELQSANEELTTVNDELQEKIRELAVLNADLANYFNSTNIAVIFLDDEFMIRDFTPASTEIFRLIDTDRGRALTDIGSIFDIERVMGIAVWARDNNKEITIEEKENGGRREFLLSASPYVSSENEAFGVVLSFVDVTSIKSSARALEKANESLERQYQELDEIYRTVPQGMALINDERKVVKANDTFAGMVNLDGEDAKDKPLSRIQVGDAVRDAVENVFSTGAEFVNHEIEMTSSANDVECRILQMDCYPINRDQEIQAVGLILRDVTGQRLTEKELERVMRELQHRVKNMLANVLALVRQAERSDRPAEETISVLSRRITSLSNTHKILTHYNWRSTHLNELIAAEITDVYGSNEITIKGPNLPLGPRATLSFAMALHELATNAAKYGALSTDSGTLNVHWGIHDVGEGPKFVFNWEESNGPAVEKPTKAGFGTSLISSSIEASLDGEVEIQYEPGGLKCRLETPVKRLQDGL